MKKLYVDLGEKSYNIVFAKSFDMLCSELNEIKAPKKLLVVTDSNVEKLYAGQVMNILQNDGYDADICVFEAGEQSKHMDTILRICSACLEHKMDRKSMIIALGGGVVGDMAGFAAAIFMRGIDFVQIPTTLLSQSDSSVGGKTGIDFMQAKNILGAFHQPKLVYINSAVLKTLPEREFVSGMGEVIKHAVIRDSEFFDYIRENIESIKAFNDDVLLAMTYKNCSIKAEVVSADEKENGMRADLNFGHTFGHAVESYSDFKLSHGECVGLGMLAAAYTAKKRKMIAENELIEIKEILQLYGFRTEADIDCVENVIELMQKDKKKSNGRLKFVLPSAVGSVVQCTDVTETEIKDAFNYIKRV